jgi:hypothetical protein
MAVAECVPNIGPQGRRQRLIFGVVALVLGVGAAVGLAAAGIDRSWRVALFLPFVAGGFGIFQALART